MNSPAPKTTPTKTTATTPGNSLSAQLQQIGLCAVPAQLDDFIARATKSRWSAHQILEQLVKAEGAERSRRSLERRLRISGIKSFKPMADFDWSWPAKIERDVIERALTLDFLGEARNLVMVGRNGLGKTMIAQNLCHTAVLAGHSVLFRSAAALLEDLHRQSPEGRRRKLRTYANVGYRRGRLSFIRRQSGGSALRSCQPAIRTQAGHPHYEQTLQGMERSLSQRHLHRHAAGSSAASRRGHSH